MRISKHFALTFLIPLIVGATSATSQLSNKITRDMTVNVKLDRNTLPGKGQVGTDVMISKKGRPETIAHLSKLIDVTKDNLEIPFVFRNIPSVEFNDELIVTAYSSTFNVARSKWVGMKKTPVKARVREITVEMPMEEVDSNFDFVGGSASNADPSVSVTE